MAATFRPRPAHTSSVLIERDPENGQPLRAILDGEAYVLNRIGSWEANPLATLDTEIVTMDRASLLHDFERVWEHLSPGDTVRAMEQVAGQLQAAREDGTQESNIGPCHDEILELLSAFYSSLLRMHRARLGAQA